MKICCCSCSFDRALHSGALTQLEFIDRCAELALDGVDLAAAHFPRTDDDYLAQIKKLCADRGLTVAAVSAGSAFGEAVVDPHIEKMRSTLDVAAAVGAPLVRFACGAAAGSPAIAWRELVRGLKYVAMHAKQRNVTLALQPRAGSLVSEPLEVKRALKECDSSWLRLAPAVELFGADPTAEWPALLVDAVLAVASGAIDEAHAAAVRSAGFLGFVTLDISATDEDAAVRAAVDSVRSVSRP